MLRELPARCRSGLFIKRAGTLTQASAVTEGREGLCIFRFPFLIKKRTIQSNILCKM